jgi:bacillithiol synthase
MIIMNRTDRMQKGGEAMQVIETNPLPSSQFFKDYLFDFSKVEKYFSYHPNDKDAWKRRLSWLSRHPKVNRGKLVKALTVYNERINNHEAVLNGIQKLQDKDTYVVIGGQQAGILTGPMLVIHKAITIIKLAEEMKKSTGHEMIPVFWIASEDHDFAEVNHAYVSDPEGDLVKVKLSEKGKPKASVGEIFLEQSELNGFMEEFFSYLPDSQHQLEIRSELQKMVDKSNTLSDLFARIMSWLFGKHGLVLVDSSDPMIRELEIPVFNQLIDHNLEGALLTREQELIADGYNPQLDNLQGNGNFFLHLSGERHLMMREQHLFISKNGVHRFTADELKQMLQENPCLFSANVVSRPIMQESLFPVAAFVGGPGEIAYWAQLKPVFESFSLQMPIAFPRMTFTLVERNIASYMDHFHLTYDQACYEWEIKRQEWIMSQGAGEISEDFVSFKTQFLDLYKPFLNKVCATEPGAKKLGEANLQRMAALVDFFEKKTMKEMEKRHHAGLDQWLKIKQSLYPIEKPQERVYNIFGYLNGYGTDLIDNLLNQSLSLSANHKLIYI